MTLFRNVIGIGINEEGEESIKTLAGERADATNKGVPATESTDDGASSEVPGDEIELTYRHEAQVFNSINLKTQMIMGAGHELRCDDGKVLEHFTNFLDNLGEVGEESTWEEILEKIFQNTMAYGKHFVENVYNSSDEKIVDLVCKDPKSFDYARNAQNKIVFDIYGKPVGFTQSVPYAVDRTKQGDPAPENVALKNNQIFLLPKRLAFFKLYTIGDGLNPIGLIEPGYKSVIRKQNIQEAQTNSIYARGTFPIIDYVGSPERFPTPKMIKHATEKLQMMQHNRYFAFPYWHRIEPIEVKQSEMVDNSIKALKEEITASLGMPLAFSMGSGEATNRATLNNQQEMMEFSLNNIVKKVISVIRKQIFKRISEAEGFKDAKGKLIIPGIVWGDVGAEDKDAKAQRLVNYLKVGAITPDYVMPYVIKSEELSKDVVDGVPQITKKPNLPDKPKKQKI